MKSTSDIDPRLLVTLLAVLRHGSMSAAATALGYVPSAVSQQITRLERQIGVELLSRRPGGAVTPTTAGRMLADGAAEVLAAAADFRRLASTVAEAGPAEVRVGVYASAASRLLPGALAELRSAHPEVVLQVIEAEPALGLRVLRTGEIDLLVAYRYLPEDPPAADDLHITVLGREPLWLMTAAGGRNPPTVDACARAEWASGHPGKPDRRLLQRWAYLTGITPVVRYESDDYHTILALIAQALAVGLVPASVVLGWQDSARPVTRVELPAAPQGDPAILRPGRDVLAVTRLRSRHPVVDELVELLRIQVSTVAERT